MMRIQIAAILIAFLGFGLSASAQSALTPNTPKQSSLKEKSTTPGEHKADRYNFQEKRLFKILKEAKIPVGFPEYDKATMSAEHYDAACREWLKLHPHFVKEEYLTRL